ncbi:MAG: beta-propeller domain-containing protein [Polyangiaceae bacterium]
MGTKVVVHSTVVGEPIYAAAGATPKRKSTGTYTGGAVESSIAPVLDSNFAYSSNPLAKVTVLTLEGTQPKTTREIYYEGTYLSSRRIGSNVRTIVRGTVHEPEVDTKDVSFGAITFGPDGLLVAESRKSIAAGLAKLQAKVVAAIEASTLEDWLPRTFERKSGGIQTSATRCGDFYVPGVGTTEFGVTSIESMRRRPDVDPDPGRRDRRDGGSRLRQHGPHGRRRAGVGAVDRTRGLAGRRDRDVRRYRDGIQSRRRYASPDDDPELASSGGTPGGFVGVQNVTDPGLPDTSYAVNSTYLHLFDIATDVTTPLYVASGQVGGTVNNQFAIDEKGGLLRVATSTQLSPSKEHPTGRRENNVFVLDTVGTSLVSRGSVTGFGVDETIQSTRFLGNRAYVVTFRQTDPLFVIDLSTPSKPTILGELQIPGFSEYMHPLGDTHLLTIGRDGDPNGREQPRAPDLRRVGRRAPAAGVQVRVHEPRILRRRVRPQGLHVLRGPEPPRVPVHGLRGRAFPERPRSVQGGHRHGLRSHGSDRRLGARPSGRDEHLHGGVRPSVRRGLFLEDVAYAVASGGIVAAKVDALGSPVGSVALPVPAYAMPLSVGAPSVGCTKPVPSEPVDGGSPIDAGPAMDGGAPTPVPDAAPPTPSSDGGTDAKGD